MWAINIGTILGILIILYTPLCNFLKLYPLTAEQFLLAVAVAFLSVFWYEGVKLLKWLRQKK
jgi:Ca2+-transporting ATPase